MPHSLRIFLTGVILAVVAGCAVSRAPQVLPATNAGINTFSLTGRVAVKLAATRLFGQANLEARSCRRSDASVVPGRLGDRGTRSRCVRRDADYRRQKGYRSDNVQALTREVLGWDLPLEGLQHWVVGRAEPGLPVQAEERDARGRLTRLTQNDWHISFLDYAGDSSLPARIALGVRQSEPASDYRPLGSHQ